MPTGPDTDRGGQARPWREQVEESEEAHRESGEPLSRSIGDPERGGFSVTTPAGIEAFRALQTRSALKMHVAGLQHSRIKMVRSAAHQVLGLPEGTHRGRGANQALLDLMNVHIDTKYGKNDPQEYVEEGTEGQFEDKIRAANEAEANARKLTGFTGHVGANELLGLGTPQGNAVGRARQEAGAEPKPKPDTDPLGDKGTYKGHIGVNEYVGLGDKEGNRIAAERQARGRPVDETDEI